MSPRGILEVGSAENVGSGEGRGGTGELGAKGRREWAKALSHRREKSKDRVSLLRRHLGDHSLGRDRKWGLDFESQTVKLGKLLTCPSESQISQL